MPDDVRWIRSYVTAEPTGRSAPSASTRRRARRRSERTPSEADLPVDEIVKVADTVVVRPDPVPVAV